jgi:hypothetical protein
VVGVGAAKDLVAAVEGLATNVQVGSNDTTNTSDKRERSKRSLPFFIPNPPVEKVNAKSELINPYDQNTHPPLRYWKSVKG